MKFTQTLAKDAVQTADSASNIDLSAFSWMAVPLGVLCLWIGINLLWNRKFRPSRQASGYATASFNNILGRVLKFVFIEDKYPVYIKDKEGKLTEELKYGSFGKFIVWRNFYFLTAGISLILSLLGNSEASLLITSFLLIVIGLRTSKVFASRHNVLTRMFEVAAVELRYPRDANINPWGYVRVKKWENLIIPGDTEVSFPAAYKSEDQKNRENFERHFNGTVTDDNTWIYKWKSSQSVVSCSPVTHIPKFAPYPGSAKGEWNKIPLGLGAEGEVVWDVSIAPMALVTGTTGGGKNFSLRVLVKTLRGLIKIGDLKVGDTLFDPEGKQTKVTHLHPIITPSKAYELEFSNGEKIIADPGHLWETETRTARLSRFNGVKKESKRSRSYWLDKAVRDELEIVLANTANDETISIPEIAELVKKNATTGVFYSIAKEIGVAEEVRPKIKLYHKSTIMKQMQTVSCANSQEIMDVYKKRRGVFATKKNPITRNQFDKLRQLLTEVRHDDNLTVESMVEYLDANTFTKQWVQDNFDTALPINDAVQDLYSKADLVKSSLPDKIFSIDAAVIDARQLATILDIEYTNEFRNQFSKWAKSTTSGSFKIKKEVELIRPERTTIQEGAPYFTYPKKMFIERLLRHDSTPLNDQRNKRIYPEIRTTQEIFDTLKTEGATIYTNHSIKKAKALVMNEQALPIAPYTFGAWLGDGAVHGGKICGLDHQVFENIKQEGYAPSETINKLIKNKHIDFRDVTFDGLHKVLRENGFLHKSGNSNKSHGTPKHIPSIYLTSSIEQRRELLRGLLDTDGSVKDNGAVEFYTSIPVLRDNVKTLVASLGYIPNVTEKEPTYDYKGEKLTGQTAYRVVFQADPVDRLFGLDRKNIIHQERYNHNDVHSTADNHYIVNIREVEPEPMRCISVDSPSRLFLVSESMIPTHNSTIQRNIIFHCIQHPDRWRFLGIDVKRVELSPYVKYDPVVMGVGTNTEDGVEIIRYAYEEMMNRYTQMEQAGVNNFMDLDEIPLALMIMIDESYMFLAPSGIKTDEGKEEDALKGEASKGVGDIARLGRAAGVHLVMATQRPDATIIYGELKQNLALRIAAGKADTIASQMTLDNDNATRLPGDIKGRGYMQVFGEGEPFQGYFAPQNWIDKWLAGEDPDGKQGPAKADTPSAKKSRKRRMDKAPKLEAPHINLDKDDEPKPKKKKGLLAKINAYNSSQAGESGEGDTIESDNSPISLDKDDFLMDDSYEATTVINNPTFKDGQKQADLLNEIKNSSVENNDFIDPFGDISDTSAPDNVSTPADESFFDDDDPFGEIEETPVAHQAAREPLLAEPKQTVPDDDFIITDSGSQNSNGLFDEENDDFMMIFDEELPTSNPIEPVKIAAPLPQRVDPTVAPTVSTPPARKLPPRPQRPTR